MDGTDGRGWEGGERGDGNAARSCKDGVLRRDRVLVGFRLGLLVPETTTTGARGETRSNFALRIIAAGRSLFHRLVFSIAAGTTVASDLRIISSGMGDGGVDRSHCSRFGMAGQFGGTAFG